MFKPGVYPDMDIETYHTSEGISSSGMKVFLESPAQYYYDYHAKQKDEKTTQSFALGRLVHLLSLEPQNFDKQFYLYEDGDLPRSEKGKLELSQKASGRQIVKPKDLTESKNIADAIKLHLEHHQIKVENVEHSIFWEAGVFNAPLRARPDFYNDDLIVDIKTTNSFKEFERNYKKYGYHRQAAMQIDALKHFTGVSRAFKFLVTQSKPPYLTCEYELHPEDLIMARCEYIEIANDFAECLLYNEWPDYCMNVRVLKSKW